MNALELQLTYPLGETLPANGRSLELVPGVRWLRMTLPFALDHINLWLLRDEIDGRQGWTVVDCCVDRAEARSQWETIFANELEGLPVLRVMVTHMHPDHIGLAAWLCERWNCPLWISATDYFSARLHAGGGAGFGADLAMAFFASHGLAGPEGAEAVRSRSNHYSNLVPAIPAAFRRLQHGQRVRIGGHDWDCIAGYGHAPEHIAFHCQTPGLLIGGDMMLPRISTNISVQATEPEADPLSAFLASLDGFRALPVDTLTLPAHGKPFTGLHLRVDQLQTHHQDRLAEVMQACAESPKSAAQIVPVMFRRALDTHQTIFALGEAIAHLHLLWHQGQLRRTLEPDGVWRFAPA